MSILELIEREISMFPEANIQDIYKLFFQDYFGPAHFNSSKASVKEMIIKEMINDSRSYARQRIQPLFYLNKFFRVDLIVLKEFPFIDEFSEIFVESMSVDLNQPGSWVEQWQKIITHTRRVYPHLTKEKSLLDELSNFSKQNLAVHHSNKYREKYIPHYRLIESELLRKSRFSGIYFQ